MHKRQHVEEIERFKPNVHIGLSSEQVDKRKKEGLNNKTTLVVGKSLWEILRTNVFTFFNTMLFIIAGVMIYANVNDGRDDTHWYTGIFFVSILLANIIIGLYQDLKAKHLMKKMKIITSPKVRVLRDGNIKEISVEEVVLDDVISLKASDQIISDSVVLEGEIYVDESLLTGESVHVYKGVGDIIYSGTFVVSGKCYSRADKVGKDNYVEQLASKAKAFKRNPSHILSSLKKLFRSLGAIVITIFAIVLTTYIIQFALRDAKFTFKDFINMVGPLGGQLVAMIPSGLYLLTSMALATGVISLYRKHANVQDLYSIEMLARADTLCVDKTGTITDGSMSVYNVVSLSKMDEAEVGQIIFNVVNAIGDENATALAMKKYFVGHKKIEAVTTLPFNSENKYSGATLSTGVTYILGALEFLNIPNKTEFIKKAEQYTSLGLRVVVLAKGNELIKDNRYDGVLTPLAFIVLQDHIKEDALKTFTWFKENGVDIKVISGDNARTVSEIAKQAGIDHADQYISLEGKSLDEVKELATQYTVFGRVTPEQKEAIVLALKAKGKTVAMTGDGVNDILALKRADCSIAMNSGAAAAKNISHVVLMNNDFSTMPEIVGEGRRVINNLQRTGCLFLTKSMFAIAMSLIFWIVSIATANKYTYPFSTNNMLIWEVFGLGLTAFFIALEPNSAPIKQGFLRNIFWNATPFAIAMILVAGAPFIMYALQDAGVLYTGVDSFGFFTMSSRDMRYGATAMAVISFSIMAFVILFLVARPLNKYRGIVIGVSALAGLACLIIPMFEKGRNVFHIDFSRVTAENWIGIGANVIFFAACLILFIYIRDLFKEGQKKNG